MKPSSLIESLLFSLGEPVTKTKIASLLSLSHEEVEEALADLERDLEGRGVRLMRRDETVTLVTARQAHELLRSMHEEELKKDLGKAGSEVLTIILYSAPVTRRHVNYIRGVNSSSVIRALLVRGLIERVGDSGGHRYVYKPTHDLLSHLGVYRVEELPEYEKIREELRELRQPIEQEDAPVS